MLDALYKACESEDTVQIAAELAKLEFSLVNIAEEGEEDEAFDAMTADVEDFAALVGFTSIEHAEKFANVVEEALNEKGELPIFNVNGKAFIDNLPDFFGVLLNPESDDCMVFPPPLMMDVKAANQ